MPIILNNNNKNAENFTEKEIHIKENKSAVSIMKRDGTIVKKYPHQLYVNNEKIEMNSKLNDMINKMMKEI